MIDTARMSVEDQENHFRGQCDKMRAAAEIAAKTLESQVSSLERYVEANTKHGGDK